jgi:DNA-binding NtrC family response regulator
MNRTSKILVVEELTLRRFLIPLLQAQYPRSEIIELESADEALDLIAIERGGFDLVISNLGKQIGKNHVPDGQRIIQKMREVRPSVPIVIMTGGVNALPAEWQPNAFFHKPFDLTQVLDRIEDLLSPAIPC